jgi:hypothetical protein
MFRILAGLFGGSSDSGAKNNSTDDWPFDQPENCAVFTTTHVMQDGEDITYVSHDLEDHGWQFHYSGEKDSSEAMIVSLKNVVEHDPSVLEVADLPPGWIAIRAHRGAPWEKMRQEE